MEEGPTSIEQSEIINAISTIEIGVRWRVNHFDVFYRFCCTLVPVCL